MGQGNSTATETTIRSLCADGGVAAQFIALVNSKDGDLNAALREALEDYVKKNPVNLSRRQKEIVNLIVCQRLSTRAIASQLGISAKTVGTHVSNVLRKLQVPDRVAMIRKLVRLGIVPLDKFLGLNGGPSGQ